VIRELARIGATKAESET